MPFSKPLPEWKNAGTKPPQSKIDAGWAIGDKPPAAWWNWWMYNSYYALQELQISAVHTEKLGVASGVATLGADAKLTAAQLPAIGSAQITDGSILNTDLSTDVKVGSLATLTTTTKTSVTAAINEVKASDDQKVPLSQKGVANGVATLDSTTKVPVAQLPFIPTANLTDGSVTDAKLATDVKVGSLATLVTSAKGSVVLAINEVDSDLTNHNADNVRHITGPERATWNAAQLKKLTEAGGYSQDKSTADLNTIKDTGFYYGSSMTNGPTGTVTGWLLVHAVNANYTTQEFVINTNTAAGNRKFWRVNFNGVWNAWNEVETTTGAQAKVDAHASDAVKHITAPERVTWNAKASTAVATTSANGLMSSTDKSKLDGVASGAQVNQNAFSNVKVGTTTVVADAQSDTLELIAGNNITLTTDAVNDTVTITNSTPDATTSVSGLMSGADKTKLNGVSNGATKTVNSATNGNINIDGTDQVVYAHPTTHPPSIIAQDASNRFVSDTEKASYAAKETPTGAQTKADAALNAAKAYAVNMATTGTTTDPNATLEGYILTNHVNSPGLGLYWHIETRFYSSVSATANRSQTAQAYNSSNPRLFIRNYYSSYGWSAWNELAHTDLATSALDGLMRKEDKSKLDGVASNANNYVHPAGDGNLHVPATGTTNNGKFLEAGATAGSLAWANIDWTDIVNKPATYTPSSHGHTIAEVTGLQAALDGKSATSHVHADATTTVSGFLSAADKTKLNSISTGATKAANSATNGNIAIDGAQVTVYTHPATHDASMIVESATKRFTSDTEKAAWNAKASTAVATTSANGLMSATDKTKLDGVSTGANKVVNTANNGEISIDGTAAQVYTHPTGDGNLHVPATGTTRNGQFLKAGATAGSPAWAALTTADISGLQAQLDAPQKVKLTQDSGSAKVVSGTDLNTVLSPGIYNIPISSGLLNRPFNSNDLAILEVWGSDTTGNCVQRFTNLSNDWAAKVYTRVCRGGVWTAWKQTLYTEDAQLFKLTGDDGYTAGINGYDLNGLTWSGFFYGNNLTNSPSGNSNYHRIWVMMSSSTSGIQVGFDNIGRMWSRSMTGGTWGSWVELMTTAPSWSNLSLSNGVVEYGTAWTPQVVKIGNMVHMRGAVKNVTAADTIIATLPADYRPIGQAHIFSQATTTIGGARFARWQINNSGQISMQRTSDNAQTAGDFFPISTSWMVL
ncbi:pyocin knob domain-containing protein [Exiguobacterium sp. s127]|uniref:pyocin knob domain-containing protein n=1 Tax=Exiguobacterium sp. s127 TaxID=2751210 RepID=UPI001BED20AD|nr:pyocin knob domain-containing protein [Exiguobacterium sp. s127]